MLYRVAGKVAGGKPFTARIESSSVVGAISTVRTALNEQGTEDSGIDELRAKKISGGSAIRFGKVADANAPKRERKPKAATAPATAPATVPAAGAAKK